MSNVRYTTNGIVDRLPAIRRWRVKGFSWHGRYDIGEHAKIRGAARNVDVRGNVTRFARVGYLGLEKVVRTTLDLRGYGTNQLKPFGRRHTAPRTIERCLCRRDSVGHVSFARFMNRANLPTSRRIDVDKRLAIPALAI